MDFETVKIYYSAGAGGVTNVPPSFSVFKVSGASVTITVSTKVPVREGYTFLGWKSSASPFPVLQPGDSYNFTVDFLQLTAKWEKTEYTVSFNANGGSGAPGSRTTTDGKLKLPSAKPTKEHYGFLGWATSASATKPKYAAGSTYTFTKNTTLYAIWSCKLTMPVLTTGSGRVLYPTQQATITTTPSVNTNTHKLQVLFAGQTKTIGTDVTTSKNYTPPANWAQYITTSNSCAGTIRCYTYDADGTELGYEEIPCMIDLLYMSNNTGFKPKVGGVTIRDQLWTDEFTTKFGYIMIRGKSTPYVSWQITPSSYYATVKSTKVKYQNNTYNITPPETTPNTYLLPLLKSSPSINIELEDSRGNIDSYSTGYTYTRDYHNPRISFKVAPQRDDTTTSNLKFTYAWNISELKNTSNVAKNDKTIKIYLKKHTASSWSLKDTITPSSYAGNTEYTLANVDPEYQYDLKITATDYFGTTELTAYIPALGDITLDFAYSDGTIAAHGFSPADGKDHWYSKEMVFEKRISAAGKKLVYIAGDEISVGIRGMAYPVGAAADGKYQMDVITGLPIVGSAQIKSGSISIYKWDGTAIWENKTAKDISATSTSDGQCIIEATPMANGIVRCFMQFVNKTHPSGLNLHSACPVFGNLVLKVVATA